MESKEGFLEKDLNETCLKKEHSVLPSKLMFFLQELYVSTSLQFERLKYHCVQPQAVTNEKAM